MADPKSMRVLRASDAVPESNFPRGDEPGFTRVRFGAMNATGFDAVLMRLPAGQMSPRHTYSGEHVIYQLEGSIEFRSDDEAITLSKGDLLFIPPDIWYEYSNIGEGEATYLGVTGPGPKGEWPARSVFA